MQFFAPGNYTQNTNGSIDFSDYGQGLIFIPSGLGYFGNAQASIPAYSPLIFSLNVYTTNQADHDADGILSFNEDVDGDGNPFNDDTDGDGATDGEEVNGLFGGSNPTDPDAKISALTGKFIYEGIEEGTYFLLLTAYPDNDTGVQTDISFDSTTNVIRSASGSFPDLTNWSAISILGSGDNDGIYEIDFSQAPTAFEIKLLESVQFEAAGASIRVTVAGQNDLSFESASRTIRTSTGHFGGAAHTEFQKWDTFSIFVSQENDGVYTVVSVATNAITVKESLTDEPAGTTVFFRRDPQRLQVPGSGINGDAYVVRGIPTHLRYTISGFLDVNGNGELDRLIDPQAHFLDGATMPGRNFNDLSIDLPLQDPDGSNIRILAVDQDPSGPLARKIIWKSIPGKTYRIRYSHDSPAGPYNNYVLGTGGLPKEIYGYSGEDQTALIHYAASINTYYRVEVKTGDAVQVDGGDISFVANTRAIISSSSSFPLAIKYTNPLDSSIPITLRTENGPPDAARRNPRLSHADLGL